METRCRAGACIPAWPAGPADPWVCGQGGNRLPGWLQGQVLCGLRGGPRGWLRTPDVSYVTVLIGMASGDDLSSAVGGARGTGLGSPLGGLSDAEAHAWEAIELRHQEGSC